MGKITIKNLSSLTETAALLRVIAFISSDFKTALHVNEWELKRDVSIEHISRSFGVDEYIVKDVCYE